MNTINTTVIIPTLNKAPDLFVKNIETLMKQDCFIHLIDNSVDGSCKVFEGTRKILISYFPQNIGVNKAWNYGVNLSKTRYYLLLNDDCLVWDNVISKCEEIMDDQKISIVTFATTDKISSELYCRYFMKQRSESKLRAMDEKSSPSRMGWFIFGRKCDWTNIPDGLIFFFGDDFIYKITRKKGMKTVIDLANIVYHRPNRTTRLLFDSAEFMRILEKESDLFKQIEKDYGLNS